MTNLWGFLLQTLTVSLVAVFLFLIKQIFYKLSPRWQYWLWGLLAARMLIPVSVAKQYVFLPFTIWIEAIKGMAEEPLVSAYTAVYIPIKIKHPLPWIQGAPTSITDWLFVLYSVGVLVVVLYDLYSYIRLRLRVHRGTPVTEEVRRMLDGVCAQYQLKSCSAVAVEGMTTPFVCGWIHPVLVLPQKVQVEETVLLHKLLHMKYHDALQSLLWRLFFALHWCNPLLQILIFRRIGHDMEALCDQRVLELLEGKADYGNILVSMVNEKKPCLPGAPSVTNGKKRIEQRIADMGRFQKEPKGMAVLAVCMMLMLVLPVLLGTRHDSAISPNSYTYDKWNFSKLMAAARTTRCTTVAGALDTYAKGIMGNNGMYLAAASPLSQHEKLAKMMQEEGKNRWPYDFALDGGLSDLLIEDGYAVYDLKQQDDGSYTAWLVFFCAKEMETRNGSEITVKFDRDLGYYAAPYEGSGELVLMPVTVQLEDAWVVMPHGERQVHPVSEHRLISEYGDLVPVLGKTYVGVGNYGRVQVTAQDVCIVDNTRKQDASSMFRSGGGVYVQLFDQFDTTPKPTATFDLKTTKVQNRYTLDREGRVRSPQHAVTVLIASRYEYDDFERVPYFVDTLYSDPYQDYDLEKDWSPGELKSTTNSDGSSWARYVLPSDQSWDRQMVWNSFVTYGDFSVSGNFVKGRTKGPVDYAAQIYWDDTVKETFVLEELQEDA